MKKIVSIYYAIFTELTKRQGWLFLHILIYNMTLLQNVCNFVQVVNLYCTKNSKKKKKK